SVTVIGIVGLVSRAVAESRVVADQTKAAYLASEGLEITKNILDSNGQPWNSGFSGGSYEVDYESTTLGKDRSQLVPPCTAADLTDCQQLYFDSTAGLYGYPSSFPVIDSVTPTTFKRVITIVVPSGSNNNEIDATSTVSWVSKSGTPSEISVSTDFFNWRK
ncbi:MAG TPA: hypothetical protein VMU70_00135, partial [Candidatus Tyrphobacter sp.]|nr:hypothetical protein [Candidatus Tyrphobacter sp.]